MVQDNRNPDGRKGDLYRVRVAGHLPRSRWSWFGAEAVRFDESSTVFHARVQDQADLLGRLRKIHDLNLRLISVERWTDEKAGMEEAGDRTDSKAPSTESRG